MSEEKKHLFYPLSQNIIILLLSFTLTGVCWEHYHPEDEQENSKPNISIKVCLDFIIVFLFSLFTAKVKHLFRKNQGTTKNFL